MTDIDAGALSTRQLELLAAIEQYPFTFTGNPVTLDGMVTLGEDGTMQNMSTVRALIRRGLVAAPAADVDGGPHHARGPVLITDAGRAVMDGMPDLRAATKLIGWAGEPCARTIWRFSVGETRFRLTTERLPSDRLAEQFVQLVADAMESMYGADPAGFDIQVDILAQGQQGAFVEPCATAWEAVESVYVTVRDDIFDAGASFELALD